MRSQAMQSRSETPINLAEYRWRQVGATGPRTLKSLDSVAIPMTYHRGQEICAEGYPADFWYCVISGVARQCALRADGRRQIVGLLLPGDCFGFTAGHDFDFGVEAAVDETVVAAYPRTRAELMADSNPEIARDLRKVTFEAMARMQAQLLTLGRVTVTEKVAAFLVDMARRSPPGGNDNVALPVTRYEIADYLAVSVETVSRSLTGLKQRGLIKFCGTRTLKIVDPDALEECGRESLMGRAPNGAHFSASRRRAAS